MALSSGTTHVVADDGTRLALHVTHPVAGCPPVVCVPGGPLLDSDYLGDLGRLAEHRQLALLDHRGAGRSETPQGPEAYRWDRLVDDVEAVRRHLGVDSLDLLAHSAGANTAYRYLERHPGRVARLVLVTPSVLGVGIEVTSAMRRAVVRARAVDAAWYATAAAAFEAVQDGTATDDDRDAMAPLSHGDWSSATQDYAARMDERRDQDAVNAFFDDDPFDPAATRPALARCEAPVLVLAGGHDVGMPPWAMEELAGLFPTSRLEVQPGAGHFPWRDDPEAFGSLVASFLDAPLT